MERCIGRQIYIKNYITYNQAKFYNDNNLAVFIDARDIQEIDSEKGDNLLGSISHSLIIPVTDVEIIDSETEYFYSDISLEDYEFILSDFKNEMKTVLMLDSLSKDINYIVYCGYKECDKSENLAEYMMNYFNFENVGIYKGGWEDWLNNQNLR